MNVQAIRLILADIKFKDHGTIEFVVGSSDVERADYIQLRDTALDPSFNSGRKWRLSPFMTRSEIVQTALSAWLAWVEHEAREAFLYQGKAIFGPHLDVDVLAQIAHCTDVRT